jgi:hypothetical protein
VDLPGVTFVGPEVDDPEVLAALPRALRDLLGEVNGLVAFDGGLHLRGACRAPGWHALREAWRGERSFRARYPAVEPGDVPFAQDAVGDQWLLRGERVLRLLAETGAVEDLGRTLGAFLADVERDPVDTLGLHPLLQFQAEGGTLEPGRLLMVYPPFCAREAAGGVTLRAIPAGERLDFLAHLAAQLS